MAGRFRPEHGADSAEAWNPVPWRVLMEDAEVDGLRFEVRIPAAIGRHDARNQARDRYPDAIALREWKDDRHEAEHVEGACAQCSLA